MGTLKCGISQKLRIIERKGQKFGTRGATVHKCMVLLMPNSLSLAWGHSVHFVNFPIFDTLLLHNFSLDFNKLHTKYHNQGPI